MAYIDSSTTSGPTNGLAALASQAHGDDEEREEDDELEERPREARRGSLLENLIDQIGDVNLARRLPQGELDRIGMEVVREYEIDNNSRADWEQMAREAMRFTLQVTDEKEYPFPRASNVIFPLLSQAATEFGARAYPAVIQGNKVVKGVVWGSDRGTPIKDDAGNPIGGAPPMAASAPPGPPGAPPGAPGALPGLGGGPPTPPAPQWLIEPGEKRQRAERISEHMSWQLLVEMKEWEPQTDQLLHQLPVIGGAVRKTFRNFAENRNESLFVGLLDLVWNYRAASFETAPRHTEKLLVYPHEIVEYERAHIDENEEGMWLHLEYGPGDASTDTRVGVREASGDDLGDESAPHLFLEQHRRLDLDDDGYPEPYAVTVHKRSGKVVRICARYDEDGITASDDGEIIQRIEPEDHYTLIRFLPAIDGGSYPIGLGHLVKPLNEAINTTLNQMFDAGHLQNAGGGFIGEELGVASGQVLFQVGRFVRVKTRGQAIRDSVFPIPFPGPSPVLFQLLGTLVEAAKGVAGIQNVLVGDAAIANAPPTTILALIEQGLGFYTAIVKRVFRGLTSEYQKLHRLNKKYLTEKTQFQLGDEEKEIGPDDYKFSGGVTTVADPRMTTDMQRLGRANLLATFKDDPLVNQREVRLRILEAANIERIDDLMAPPDPNAAILAQFAMAKAQAELGRERAAEQKDQTQAFLNLALARSKASGPEEAFIDKQLEFLRLQIEAVNSSVRAAAVDHAFHDTHVRAMTAEADRAAAAAESALQSQGGASPPVQPTPGPAGPFPAGPGPAPAPGGGPPLPAPSAAGGAGGPGLPPLPNLETPGQGQP